MLCLLLLAALEDEIKAANEFVAYQDTVDDVVDRFGVLHCSLKEVAARGWRCKEFF